MEWLLGTSKEIIGDKKQLEARLEYIQQVTNSEVTPWSTFQLQGKISPYFLCCKSKDGLNGIFISAHVDKVVRLCCLKEIAEKDFVIANTCIWQPFIEKALLFEMIKHNRKAELWYAKQSLFMGRDHILHQTTTIQDIGRFGFQTSVSERNLFKHRDKGFMEAVNLSYEKVSPIIFTTDLGGSV